MSFSFWQKWLIVVCIYNIVFGLLLALFGQFQFMDVLLNQYFDPIFWPDGQITEGALQYKNWITSVLGSVVASWGMLIGFIAYYPFRRKEKWAWNAIAIAVLFWFVIDTACSLYYDVAINAAFNLFTLALLMMPLLFTRKYFYE
jgi:hypothetical protein